MDISAAIVDKLRIARHIDKTRCPLGSIFVSQRRSFARLFCLPTTVPSYSWSLCFHGIPHHVSFGISLKMMHSNNDSWHFPGGISCACCPSVIHPNWQQLRTIPEKNSYLCLCWRTTQYWNWTFVKVLCIFKVNAFGGSWLPHPVM